MSDDNLPTENPATHTSAEAGSSSKNPVTPAIAVGFVIIALLGVLIAMIVKDNSFGSLTGGDARLAAIKSDIDARRTELNRQRAVMGLSPVEGSSEPLEDISARLKKDMDSLVALSARYQQMLTERDTETSAKSAEILRSEKLRQSLYSENTRLRSELNRALVGGSEATNLRADLAELKTQRDALATELAAAQQNLLKLGSAASTDDLADLQRRLDETLRAKDFFEAKVKELQGDLSKAKLFATTENELLPAAVELFRNLRTLESLPDSEITSAYSSLAVKLGADVMVNLSFATGSSVLSASDEAQLRQKVTEVPDGDLILAIGYASKTGNEEGNRVLSSDRATAAAQMVTSVKRPEQSTQAVYLGQTDRFSSGIPERNQLVEIWHIRRK